MDLIKSSSCIVTSSAQTALEAKASGAKVIYIDLNNSLYPLELLSKYSVDVVNGFDAEAVAKYLEEEEVSQNTIKRFDENRIQLML